MSGIYRCTTRFELLRVEEGRALALLLELLETKKASRSEHSDFYDVPHVHEHGPR